MDDIILAILKGVYDADSSLKASVSSESASGGYSSARSFSQSRRTFPVNWELIKLNLTPEQIMECFNVEALSSGNVKIEDLLNYVNIGRLKEIFSEPQLRDMIDLDFFEAKKREKEAVFKTSKAPDFKAADKIAAVKTKVKKAKTAKPAKEEVPEAEGFEFSKNSVINGIIWKEILDVPLSRRVYGRR